MHTKIVAEPSALVLARTSYVDSIEIQQNRYFRSEFLKLMKRECGSMVGPEEFSTYGGRTRQRLWLHRPSRRAVAHLTDKGCVIVQVHVALDLLCATPAGAGALQRFLDARLLLSMLPYDQLNRVETTTYYGFTRPRGTGKKIATYSDRPSKVANRGHCGHVEVRVEGALALLAAELRTAEQVLNMNHREFWEKHVRLVEVPSAEALGARYVRAFVKNRKRASAKFPYGGRTPATPRYGHLLLRTSQDEHGSVIANNLIHLLRERRPLGPGSVSDLFRPIPTDWLLPPPQSGLWRKVAMVYGGGP